MDNKTVLIVDDEPKMQRVLEIMLKQMGHTPLLAGNGIAALQQMESHHVDLIVSDLQMPQMNGMQLLATLREQENDLPFIMITAYGTVESAVEAMKHGACDYVIRPFDVEQVELSITRALALSRVQQENRFLRAEVSKGWGEFVGQSAAMRQVYELIGQVARGKTNVLLVGETGTGKELAARAIHQASPRKDALFVPINCAAIPADILESELFGHTKGAFTGAHKDRIGKFEMASGGTLFLDEITEMQPALQAKLLRVLQEGVVERLGSNYPISVDVRVIAATNRAPRAAIADGKLREDLYYRIQVFTVELPPLRKRLEDIPILANHFLHKHGAKLGISVPGTHPAAITCLQAYHWPGNVRELENVMERAVVLSDGGLINVRHLPLEIAECAPYAVAESSAGLDDAAEAMKELSDLALDPAVEALERQYIGHALEQTGGNKTKAARLLDISERSLWYKLKKYALA
ncbi:MAG: sigma-54-dependent Fis family transcriptional regulator [Methylococcaceae bacterium]|nr:MAG: sigma-54-dependent Fis family transcriptional regulator [Methylococcaceae bacterium]